MDGAPRTPAHRSGKQASPKACTTPHQTPPKITSDTTQLRSKPIIRADTGKRGTQRNNNAKKRPQQTSSGAKSDADTEQTKHHRRSPKHSCTRRHHRSGFWFSRNAALLWLCILSNFTWSAVPYSPSYRHIAGLTNPNLWSPLPDLHLTHPPISWRNSTNPNLCSRLPDLHLKHPPPSWSNADPTPRCRWSRSNSRPSPAPPDAPLKLQNNGR